MRFELSGMGFKKKMNVPAGTKLSDLKEKLENRKLNTFYKQGKVLAIDYEIKEGDSIMAVTKEQQPELG